MADASVPVVIRTRALTRDFGPVRALDSLTLDVPRGIVFGLLGPKGSGKTTTIRLLLGLAEPTSGSAEVLGHDVTTEAGAVRERCGALLGHHGLYEKLSAEDNLDFYGRTWRMTGAVRRARIHQVLSHLGLWERRWELVGGWSPGMKQKLAVGRAILHSPALVFVDEPTAGLDPVESASLREDLARLVAAEGITIFLTTRDLAEAERLCTQVAVVKGGRLVALGGPKNAEAWNAACISLLHEESADLDRGSGRHSCRGGVGLQVD